MSWSGDLFAQWPHRRIHQRDSRRDDDDDEDKEDKFGSRRRRYSPPDIDRSRAKRALFGPVDHEETKRFAEEELARGLREKSIQYNFDFKNDVPLPGRWSWEKCPASQVLRVLPLEAATVSEERRTQATAPPAPSGLSSLSSSCACDTTPLPDPRKASAGTVAVLPLSIASSATPPSSASSARSTPTPPATSSSSSPASSVSPTSSPETSSSCVTSPPAEPSQRLSASSRQSQMTSHFQQRKQRPGKLKALDKKLTSPSSSPVPSSSSQSDNSAPVQTAE